jgi:hypothetical protein
VNDPFPATIRHDSHIDESVNWTPTSGGAKSCNLVLNTDDPVNPTVTVGLSGDPSRFARAGHARRRPGPRGHFAARADMQTCEIREYRS